MVINSHICAHNLFSAPFSFQHRLNFNLSKFACLRNVINLDDTAAFYHLQSPFTKNKLWKQKHLKWPTKALLPIPNLIPINKANGALFHRPH